MDKEREINEMAEVLKVLTIAYVENKTDCISETYRYAYRTVGEFSLSVPCMASEKAYNHFFNRTGQDIRNYKRNQSIKDLNGERFFIYKEYMYEHYIPAAMFRDRLVELHKKKDLTIENIKNEILKQKMCWITKDEDKELTKRSYQYKRPEGAYLEAGIIIKKD